MQTKAHNVLPTIGFNVEVFKHDRFVCIHIYPLCELFLACSISFTVWDMSGQGRYRNLWEHYYEDIEAVIFVVDSSDKLRMSVAQEELKTLLTHRKIQDRNIPILLLANKMDIRGSLTAIQCSKAMDLDLLAKDRSYHICSTNALTGDGLEEAVQWLSGKTGSL
jgi:ADP-ribosylation factor-like protein 6